MAVKSVAILGSPNLPASVAAYANEVGARPFLAGRDFAYRVSGATWDFESPALTLRALPLPALRGEHQVGNAANALAALAFGIGMSLTHDVVSTALRAVRIAGRFQIVPGEIEWVLDVAHNVPAAEGLSASLSASSASAALGTSDKAEQ